MKLFDYSYRHLISVEAEQCSAPTDIKYNEIKCDADADAVCGRSLMVRHTHKPMQERKPNRLIGYDYSSPGIYFVTICVHTKLKQQPVFGQIINNEMVYNETGAIAQRYWQEIPNHYNHISIDEFIIMPDHIHGIIYIESTSPSPVGAEQCSAPTGEGEENEDGKAREKAAGIDMYANSGPTESLGRHYGRLSKIVKSFKNACTKEFRFKGNSAFEWQRSFYDHIIQNDFALNNIRKYIRNNPMKWTIEHNQVEARVLETLIGER